MTSLSGWWKALREPPPQVVPASEALRRNHESSSGLRPVPPAPSNRGSASWLRPVAPTPPATATAEATPVQPVPTTKVTAAPRIAPPPWQQTFPTHYQALCADLIKRGDDIANWEIRDGRDLGVDEHGHTVAFVLHKVGTSATIQVELTMSRGQLSKVRVR
jgi:hypothetical protein